MEPRKVATPHLFRNEALAHASARQFGSIILSGKSVNSVVLAVCVVLALSVVAFFGIFDTTRKVTCQGILLPDAGLLRVTAEQPGRVVKRHVREGQAVRAGDQMFVLSSARNGQDANSTEDEVSGILEHRKQNFGQDTDLLRQQFAVRIGIGERRVGELGRLVGTTEAQLGVQTRRVQLAERMFDRHRLLHSKRFISEAQLQIKEIELLEQRQRALELTKEVEAAKLELGRANADLADLQAQLRRELGAIERSISLVDQEISENDARRAIAIRAPVDGVVAAINTQAGQSVPLHSVLAVILPAGSQLTAEVYAPSRAVGFVTPGMKVQLRYQAFPFQKFGHHEAIVSEVAQTALTAAELSTAQATGIAEPLYRIRLTLNRQTVTAYGAEVPLKSGMLVEASIMLERRKLYEWILEPLVSITGKL